MFFGRFRENFRRFSDKNRKKKLPVQRECKLTVRKGKKVAGKEGKIWYQRKGRFCDTMVKRASSGMDRRLEEDRRGLEAGNRVGG